MGRAARRNRCVRPSLRCRISSACSSTRKCLEIAGTEIEKGRANSVPEASPCARRSKMARRVGSASAKKTVVSCSDESLTMQLSIRRSWIVVKGPLSASVEWSGYVDVRAWRRMGNAPCRRARRSGLARHASADSGSFPSGVRTIPPAASGLSK